MAKPLLDLSTLAEEDRPTVQIDGVAYPFRRVSELSVLSYDWVARTGAWFESLKQREDFSEAEEQDVSQRLRRLVRLVLDAPAPVIDKLQEIQVMAVCMAFIALPEMIPQTPGATRKGFRVRRKTTHRSTGANSSRRSSGTTAATPGGGSR